MSTFQARITRLVAVGAAALALTFGAAAAGHALAAGEGLSGILIADVGGDADPLPGHG